MKRILFIVSLIMAIFAPCSTDAQKLVDRKLRSSDPKLGHDDKVYQWIMYTYVMGADTLDAAYDINGNRITPNGYRRKDNHDPGVYYVGGGMFEVRSKKRGKFGGYIVGGYNTEGKCIFSQTLMELLDCVWIHHIGYGLFELQTFVADRQCVFSLYNKSGECLIPMEMGCNHIYIPSGNGDLAYVSAETRGLHFAYDLDGKSLFPKSYYWLGYYEECGLWIWQEYNDSEHITYSRDLRFMADGFYISVSEFNGKKRPNPHYNGPYNFGERTASSSPANSTTHGNNGNNQSTPTQQQPTPQPQPQPQPRQPQPMQVWVPCGVCNGSGQCHICGGLGWKYTSYDSHATCTICGGNGKCNMCAGHGGHNEIQYR